MAVHYHGTPLSPRSALLTLAGKHFCVPFSDPRDADVCVQIGQSVMWDNGAYSAFTQGTPLNVPAFYAWVEPRLAHPHWAVVPDIIDGDVDEQRAQIATWPFPKFLGAPVWHTGLPIDWLLELADKWPRVCFGSSGRYWQIGSSDWCRRTDEAFNALAQRHTHLPWIHMLRGMQCVGRRWPFTRVDSTDIGRNHTRPHNVAWEMAGRWNSPLRRWRRFQR